ncbi:MAG: hypothetical protein WCG93_10200 [Paludibacter sp.]
MKKINYLSVLISSVSLSLLVSCTNDFNAPEADATYFSTVATEAFSTSVTETAVYDAEASIKIAIASANLQKVGLQKEDSKDPDAYQDSINAISPKVTCISEKDTYPKEYVIDYGKDGYTNKNKVKYRGQVHYTVSDKASTKKEYKFNDLYINDNLVGGSRTVETVGKGILRIVSEEKNQLANGKSTYRYSERTRTKVETKDVVVVGDGDKDEDDVKGMYNSYSYVIYTKGINAKGVEYTIKTEEPVVTVYNKKGFVSGIINVSTGKGSKHLDYSKENKENNGNNGNSENNSNSNNSNNNSDNNSNNNSNSNSDNNSNANSNANSNNKN